MELVPTSNGMLKPVQSKWHRETDKGLISDGLMLCERDRKSCSVHVLAPPRLLPLRPCRCKREHPYRSCLSGRNLREISPYFNVFMVLFRANRRPKVVKRDDLQVATPYELVDRLFSSDWYDLATGPGRPWHLWGSASSLVAPGVSFVCHLNSNE